LRSYLGNCLLNRLNLLKLDALLGHLIVGLRRGVHAVGSGVLLGILLKVDIEAVDVSGGDIVDETVDLGHGERFRGVLKSSDTLRLDDVVLVHVEALFKNVELNEATLLGIFVGDGVKLILVEAVDITEVGEPVLEGSSMVDVVKSGLDSSATVVSTDYNVGNIKNSDAVSDGSLGSWEKENLSALE